MVTDEYNDVTSQLIFWGRSVVHVIGSIVFGSIVSVYGGGSRGNLGSVFFFLLRFDSLLNGVFLGLLRDLGLTIGTSSGWN